MFQSIPSRNHAALKGQIQVINESANNLILRLPQVKARTGLSRTSIYNYMRGDERFPSSVRLGARAVGWVNQEVDAWLGSRISARQREWKA